MPRRPSSSNQSTSGRTRAVAYTASSGTPRSMTMSVARPRGPSGPRLCGDATRRDDAARGRTSPTFGTSGSIAGPGSGRARRCLARAARGRDELRVLVDRGQYALDDAGDGVEARPQEHLRVDALD